MPELRIRPRVLKDRILLACLGLGATLAIAAGLAMPEAHAFIDPHIPQPAAGYCPGGGDGGYQGFCDGIDFPDGTFVHSARGFIPFKGWTNTLYCASTHEFIPAHAGPGGCGGLL